VTSTLKNYVTDELSQQPQMFLHNIHHDGEEYAIFTSAGSSSVASYLFNAYGSEL
jgi:hypothetical protein